MKPNSTYAEFWHEYMRSHRHPANRALHCLGIVLAVAGLATAAIWGPAWLAVPSIALGYGLSWFGHFVIEGNRPESFGHPVWSLVSAFRMCAETIAGAVSRSIRPRGSGR